MFLTVEEYTTNTMNLKKIIKLISEDMNNVNTIIYEHLNSNISLVNQLSKYTISGGGKRIRPIVVLLTAKALHYYGKQHIMVAALMEFIHTATLLHDDVMDESTIRRNKATANAIFGNSASVLVGDYIYACAFQMMVSLESSRVLSLMSESVKIIVEGEVLQLTNCNNPDIKIENYMKVIYCKTARLFETSSKSAAILSNASKCQEIALQKYGQHIGTAFQLIDDLLDYNADEKTFSKNIGNDLNEGKPTLPLLHAMKNGTAEQNLLIRKAIKIGNSRHLLKKILETMHQCGSLEYTYKKAQIEIEKAINYLECLSSSPYRDALESLAYLILNRCS